MNEPNQFPNSFEKAAGSSKRIVVIIAIVVLVGIIAAGAVIAAAVGIVLYSASTAGSDGTVASTNRIADGDDGTFPNSRTKTKDRTDALVEVLKGRASIGAFTLQNIIPSTDNKAYGHSQGEAKAIYTNGASTVTLLAAEYASRSQASVEFGRMLGRERSRGARIVVQPKVQGDTINAVFETADDKKVAFCNWPPGKAVLCHLLSSRSAEALNEFRAALKSGT